MLPEGGADAISQEDLQRDVSALRREDARVVLERRFAQVHADRLVMSDDRVCAVVEGGTAPVVVVRADWPGSLATQVQAASLISLAKALDGAVPAQTTWLCAVRTVGKLGDSGAEGGASPPSATPPPVPPTPSVEVAAVGLGSQTTAASYEQIDWRIVESEVRGQFSAAIDLDGSISARAAARATRAPRQGAGAPSRGTSTDAALRRSRGPGTSPKPSPP